MARAVCTLLLCFAALAAVAHATDGKDGGKSVEIKVAGGPTIADVAIESLSSKKISHGEKRNFAGNCEVVCKEVCEKPTTTTKCIKVPFEYELCETKPIVRIKKVCKDVCKGPTKGATVYTTGGSHSKGRRMLTEGEGIAIRVPKAVGDVIEKIAGGKSDDGKGDDGAGKGTGYQVCEKVCKEEEVDDVKETCKTVQKEKEECKTEEKPGECKEECKCVIPNSPASGEMNFDLNSFKTVVINKPEVDKDASMFSFSATLPDKKPSKDVSVSYSGSKDKGH